MKHYHILTHEDRDDLQSVSDYEISNFDLTVFWNGQKYQGSIPASVKLFVGEGSQSDYLANPISWPIVSHRFLALIEKYLGNDMQVFPAPLYGGNEHKLSGYCVVNVTRCIDALAKPLVNVDTMVLFQANIPSDAHLFRVVGHETLLIASPELFQELCGKNFNGLAFIKAISI